MVRANLLPSPLHRTLAPFRQQPLTEMVAMRSHNSCPFKTVHGNSGSGRTLQQVHIRITPSILILRCNLIIKF